MPSIVLRYFACRGRGQPLRTAFLDTGTEFTDEIVPVSRQWFEQKTDTRFAGPFGSLPVLHWDDYALAQTLPIASYLSERLGFNDGVSREEIAWREMVTSSLYLDIRQQIGELKWLRGAPEGEEAWSAWFDGYTQGMRARLPAFERLLGARGTVFFGGARPVMADYFAFETIFEMQEILGASLLGSLEDCPALQRLMRAMRERPAIRACFESGRRQKAYSGNPHDLEVLARMHADLKRRGLGLSSQRQS